MLRFSERIKVSKTYTTTLLQRYFNPTLGSAFKYVFSYTAKDTQQYLYIQIIKSNIDLV